MTVSATITTAIDKYLQKLADMEPEEGGLEANEFGQMCRTVWVKRAAEIRKAHCRELIRYHSQREVAEMWGVSEALIWQLVNR